MICTLTARRLKPGAYEAFRAAWDPGDVPPGFVSAHHLRRVDAPDEVISFGFFDGDLDALRDVQKRYGYSGQQERIAPHVEAILLDGAYEVVESLEAGG